jgi:ubiquinone/menaquinone biosynthesis C-methylase UbiE
MQRIGLRKGRKRAIHTFGQCRKTNYGYEIKKLFSEGILCKLHTSNELREGFCWVVIRPYLGSGSPFTLSYLEKSDRTIIAVFEKNKEKYEVFLDNRGRARNLTKNRGYLIEFIPRKKFYNLYEQMPLGKGNISEPFELREERIKNFLELGKTTRELLVLDASTGIKEYLRYYDKKGSLTCLNISMEILKRTKEWLRSSSASFIAYDAEVGFPFKEEAFDLVVCDALLEYVSNPQEVLADACRVVKKGGTMIILEPITSRYKEDFYPQDLWEIALWRPQYDPNFNSTCIEITLGKKGMKQIEKREMTFYYDIYDKVEFRQGILKVQKSFIQ